MTKLQKFFFTDGIMSAQSKIESEVENQKHPNFGKYNHKTFATPSNERLLLHYKEQEIIDKEISEIESCYSFLQTSSVCTVVNLACGNFVGADLFARYFTHPTSKLIAVDRTIFPLTREYLLAGVIDEIFELDLKTQFESQELASVLEISNIWIAVHPCQRLANIILQLFETKSPKGSKLLLVPCCLPSTTEMKKRLGLKKWWRKKEEVKAQAYKLGLRGKRHWMSKTIENLRNEELTWSFHFVKTGKLENMKSVYNTFLFYEKIS
jgi:hypothetical protein